MLYVVPQPTYGSVYPDAYWDPWPWPPFFIGNSVFVVDRFHHFHHRDGLGHQHAFGAHGGFRHGRG